MKLGVVIGVLIGLVLVAAAAAVVFAKVVLPLTQETRIVTQTISQSVPSASIAPAPLKSPSPSIATALPAVKPGTSTAQPATTAPSAPAASGGTVNFRPNIVSVTGSGLTSRTISAQLTNLGTGDAHNVSAKVEVTSQGSRIKLNGQDSLVQSLGTIKAGTTLNLQETVSVNITDGLKILQNGAAVILTVSSDELTQSATYNYQP
jgi:hypothetical protein